MYIDGNVCACIGSSHFSTYLSIGTLVMATAKYFFFRRYYKVIQ